MLIGLTPFHTNNHEISFKDWENTYNISFRQVYFTSVVAIPPTFMPIKVSSGLTADCGEIFDGAIIFNFQIDGLNMGLLNISVEITEMNIF